MYESDTFKNVFINSTSTNVRNMWMSSLLSGNDVIIRRYPLIYDTLVVGSVVGDVLATNTLSAIMR